MGEDDRPTGPFQVRRWRRFGHDRLYVNAADGTTVGWVDLGTGEQTLEDVRLREEFERAVAEHPKAARRDVRAAAEPGPVETSPPTASTPPSPAVSPPGTGAPEPPAAPPSGAGAEQHPAAPQPSLSTGAPYAAPTGPQGTVSDEPASPSATDHEPWAVRIDHTDLGSLEAGAAARERAIAEREAAPVKTFVGRVLGVRNDERAWRIGAKGEERVAARLERLPEGWHVLHAVPVGSRGADIDHVVIGPAGVFTVNAKHHPDARVWVGGNTFMVNGHRQRYVRNSRHEAGRAARLLSAAVGFEVPVTGVIAVVGAHKGLTIKAQPDDVRVSSRKRLPGWLRRQPAVLTDEQVTAVYRAARKSTTWQ